MTSLTLRYMRTADIPQVLVIDRQSFDPPWSAGSYNYEINESSYSHMVTLEQAANRPPENLWQRIQALTGQPAVQRWVVGYGGLWHIQDEAHISTIATHVRWRGQGFGEILLAGMIRRAITLAAAYVVLEVRVTNLTAQHLYTKYEFETVGTKPRYYRNNNEDAYDMRLDLRDEGKMQRFARRFAVIQKRQPFTDHYTDAERRPR